MFPDVLIRHWRSIGFVLLLLWFSYIQGMSALAMILFASALHEMGHAFAVWWFGVRVSSLSFSLAGAQMRTESWRLSYFQECMAVLAGPLVNLLAGGVFGAFSDAFPWCTALAGANWVLGLFNLLPAAPLDGWRMLHLLLNWWLGPVTGSRVAAVCGGIFAILLAVGLLLLVMVSGGNLWLLPASAASGITGVKMLHGER